MLYAHVAVGKIGEADLTVKNMDTSWHCILLVCMQYCVCMQLLPANIELARVPDGILSLLYGK